MSQETNLVAKLHAKLDVVCHVAKHLIFCKPYQATGRAAVELNLLQVNSIGPFHRTYQGYRKFQIVKFASHTFDS